MEKYTVICEKCGGHDELTITSDRAVFYKDHAPIISARYRPDMNWGFECLCGQDSRLSPQEVDHVDILVKGADKVTLEQIAKSLTPKNELKFQMIKVGG